MRDSYLEENAAARSIALMSTLSAAVDVVHAISERRRGRDPSSQEDPTVVRPYLHAAASEFGEQLRALGASLVAADEEHGAARIRLARRMNEVLILSRLSRQMHVIHQKLLSLYPAIPEALIEDARLLQKDASTYCGGDDEEVALPDLPGTGELRGTDELSGTGELRGTGSRDELVGFLERAEGFRSALLNAL